jgi:hypothetical protein
MNDSRPALRIVVTIALILLPLILVALTLEPLERTPTRNSRSSQEVIDSPQDAPSSPDAASPTS